MNTFKKTLVAAALMSAGAAAQAEVSGSVAIASGYLWRGFDLGYGSAVVSGSVDYASEAGIYAGIWGSSGDDSYGTEYDLYAGWGGTLGEVGVDIAYVDYNYPSAGGAFDFEEIILGLSIGAFGFTYADNVDTDDAYYSVSAGAGDFSFAYGYFDFESGDSGSHIDATYTIGNAGFTLSQSFDDGAGYSEELQFVVSYELAVE